MKRTPSHETAFAPFSVQYTGVSKEDKDIIKELYPGALYLSSADIFWVVVERDGVMLEE
jgi:hypothetical protein